ncbi:hypothetical protein PMIN01_11087 [Paraphaeosphaeria minitans]|uniref:Uncharacterized protein n=1 Tax=Paraphaeosphaeria minitans TaxID=565426 RepID=A0A9P6G9Q2_9PLEO|nr:hypothetical protein PMIN01_11087 [Paraphaeosphaeria minitans]
MLWRSFTCTCTADTRASGLIALRLRGRAATSGRAPSPALAAAAATTTTTTTTGRRAAELELAWAVVKEAGAAERPLISVLQKESTGITQGAGHRIYSECPMAHRSCLPRVAWAVPGRDVQRHAVFVVGDHLCLLTPVLPSAHASAMLLTTPPADASAIRSSPACIVSLFWAHAGVAVFHVDTPA